MKLRLTPLNILTSALLVSVVYLFVFRDSEGWRVLGSISLVVLAALSFFHGSDISPVHKGYKTHLDYRTSIYHLCRGINGVIAMDIKN